jgi:hypothetical protein
MADKHPAGEQELMKELSDTSQLGRRGEVWFLAQLGVFLMVVFPPMKLHVRAG